MRLIDTSAWIHGLRPDGYTEVSKRVHKLLESGEACWCSMVRLELWNGARGAHEKRVLKEMEARLPELPIDAEVWEQACELAQKARVKGQTIPATDLLIAACARRYGVEVEHADSHFETLQAL